MFRFFFRNLFYLHTQVIMYQVVFSYFFDTIRKNMEETMKFKRLKDLREDHDKYQIDMIFGKFDLSKFSNSSTSPMFSNKNCSQ